MKHKALFFLSIGGVIASQLIDWTGLKNKVWPNEQFRMRIIETTVGDSASDDFAAITITTELTNLGRSTTVDDFRLVIRQGERRIPTEAAQVDTGTTFDFRSKVGKSLKLSGSEWLPAKTANAALQTGESRTGFLLFWSRQASGIQILGREDTQFAISFFDSVGRQHEAVYDVSRLNFQPRHLYAATSSTFSSNGSAELIPLAPDEQRLASHSASQVSRASNMRAEAIRRMDGSGSSIAISRVLGVPWTLYTTIRVAMFEPVLCQNSAEPYAARW